MNTTVVAKLSKVNKLATTIGLPFKSYFPVIPNTTTLEQGRKKLGFVPATLQ